MVVKRIFRPVANFGQNFFVSFLEELKTPKSTFENNWPLPKCIFEKDLLKLMKNRYSNWTFLNFFFHLSNAIFVFRGIKCIAVSQGFSLQRLQKYFDPIITVAADDLGFGIYSCYRLPKCIAVWHYLTLYTTWIGMFA